MTIPSVQLTQVDGSLGILPPTAGRLPAYVGACSSGTKNAPAAFGTVAALVAALGKGPLVEAAAHYIERYGKPVLVVRTNTSVAASAGSVVQTGTGATVATVHTGAAPDDDYEILIVVVTGGTVGVSGITYKYSLDGGRNFGAVKALGTGTSITIAEAGTLQVDVTTATWVAGDTVAFPTKAAQWNASDLGDSLDALKNSVQVWRNVHIIGPTDGTALDTIDTKLAAMAAAGKYHGFLAGFRIPNVGESESTYLAAAVTAFGAKATIYGGITLGACKIVSSVSGRKYRRPFLFPVAARQASVSEEVDIAAVNLGPLPCDIRDGDGNPDEHDETVNPGGDDARLITARTWENYQGVYVTNPLVLSTTGSDFDTMPKREVLNLALIALYAFLTRRLSVPVRVNKQTGFIYEPDAREIESGAKAAMSDDVMDVPKASDVAFVLDRNDNIISTKQLGGEARVTPLGYPKTIAVKVGFRNPALQTQSV